MMMMMIYETNTEKTPGRDTSIILYTAGMTSRGRNDESCYVYWPAICNVALLLTTLTPVCGLVALQWYTPTSDLLFLLWMMRRKNSWPLGSSIRCELGFSFAVTTGWPLRYHVMTGVGSPSALQLSVAGSFLATYWSSGCSVMRGLVLLLLLLLIRAPVDDCSPGHDHVTYAQYRVFFHNVCWQIESQSLLL